MCFSAPLIWYQNVFQLCSGILFLTSLVVLPRLLYHVWRVISFVLKSLLPSNHIFPLCIVLYLPSISILFYCFLMWYWIWGFVNENKYVNVAKIDKGSYQGARYLRMTTLLKQFWNNFLILKVTFPYADYVNLCHVFQCLTNIIILVVLSSQLV